jgi:hypothetical protein
MPKSRGRRPRNRSSRRRGQRSSPQRPGETWLPRLDAADRALLDASALAELAGDAPAALEHYDRVGLVRGSPHREMLAQLVELDDVLPSWVRARWLVYQATRICPPDSDDRHRAAIDSAIRALELEHPDGRGVPTDPAQVLVRLTARNWVYRQRWCFELGGLAEVIQVASPHLLSASGPVFEWVDSRLGGFRLLESRGGTAVLEDLVDRRRIEILDPGSCAQLDIGDYGIGRLVPIESAPGLMPESRLLLSDELTAGAVANDPEGWLEHLIDRPRDTSLRTLSDWDPGTLCTDVPELAWRTILLSEAPDSDELEQAVARVNAGRQTRVEDAVQLLRGVLAGWRFVPAQERSAAGYYAAAALLSPGARAGVGTALKAPRWEHAWRGLAAQVAEPARTLCVALADVCGRAVGDVAS